MMDRRRGGMRRKKVCQFCADKTEVIDFKDVETVSYTHLTLPTKA